ncbi:phosphoribosylglycinamide formyltransferase [Planomicrobium sp. YIM 101495]|uniref:phosphoribosylglycinamide formyltransferase n=1 Tax=Planomicrobium sp. YIM 101495 TaxID=2665160 RepID=UPI0012B7C86E|nr:phosphoribosylglycinamide formyltransferase [Planomicrobium sp. YIM 101495]MTD32040.1 phosphoribosylglycinamide formyltransferase [Planomicrobium sp. YIM 101495]
MQNKPVIAVFASGSGSNFQAMAEAIGRGELDAEIALVVSDKPDAYVLERAQAAGIASFVVRPSDYASKQEYEQVIKEKLHAYGVEWIVLAGFMRLIGSVLLEAFEGRIVNIHPSALPAFPGKDAIGQTVAAGSKVAGVTVHFVDAGMDTGPIIAQRVFLIEDRSREELEQEIHAIEHELYPATLQQLFAENR